MRGLIAVEGVRAWAVVADSEGEAEAEEEATAASVAGDEGVEVDANESTKP
jgi:hypothetical protein